MIRLVSCRDNKHKLTVTLSMKYEENSPKYKGQTVPTT